MGNSDYLKMLNYFLKQRKKYISRPTIKQLQWDLPTTVTDHSQKNSTFKELLGDDAHSLPAAPDGISNVRKLFLTWQEVSGLKTTVKDVLL